MTERHDGKFYRYLGEKAGTYGLGCNWVENVLNDNLQPAPGANILVLACGDVGDELIYIRKWAGVGAKINAVDIKLPSRLGRMVLKLADVRFLQEDIRNIGTVLDWNGSKPDIIICRHPHVIRGIDEERNLICEKWWASKLAEYSDALNMHGQMLVTDYYEEEADIIESELRDRGIDFHLVHKKYTFDDQMRMYKDNGVVHIGYPDSYVFKIRSSH